MNAPDRANWLAQRNTGIGGSDVAALLGLSKWKTPLQLYLEKRGEAEPQPDNEAMRWGRYLEPVVRQAYADETGNEVRMLAEQVRHPLYDHMVANLDGFVFFPNGPRRVFEAKTARTAEGWGEPRTDEIPQPYLLQVQHYMVVTGFPVADVAVLIGGADFRIYEVPADPELQQMIVDACAEFWQRVRTGNPPEPVSYADVQARWGRASKAGTVLADDELLHALSQLHDLRKQAKHLELAEEQWKAVVMKALGDHDTLIDAQGRTLCTWKASAAPQRFDSAALKAELPDVYARFVKTGEPSRRFLLK